jgi:hypothetical protein
VRMHAFRAGLRAGQLLAHTSCSRRTLSHARAGGCRYVHPRDKASRENTLIHLTNSSIHNEQMKSSNQYSGSKKSLGALQPFLTYLWIGRQTDSVIGMAVCLSSNADTYSCCRDAVGYIAWDGCGHRGGVDEDLRGGTAFTLLCRGKRGVSIFMLARFD